jgi:hypothetical protein
VGRGGLVGRALERLEETTGQTVVPVERLELLEQGYSDYRTLQREVEDIGWSIMDYVSGQPQEMTVTARRKVVQRARYVWMNDPQAGAAVELMNDFCFGRGVPRPRAKDKVVQDVIDEAWDDPDNQEVLTTLEAQLALGTDLALQSNVFLLMFDDGADGKVKLSILRHDDVTDIITDPEQAPPLLWYAVGRPIAAQVRLQARPVEVRADARRREARLLQALAERRPRERGEDRGRWSSTSRRPTSSATARSTTRGSTATPSRSSGRRASSGRCAGTRPTTTS